MGYFRDQFIAFGISVLLHCGLLWVMLSVGQNHLSDFGAPIVYSVSIEGGEEKGGIAQAPEEEDKRPPPAKQVSEPEPEEAQPEEAPEESEEEEAEPEEVEDAEVSLAEPTAVPTPKPTPKPTAVPTKKPTPKPKPTAKPTAKPKLTAKPKPTARPKPKPTRAPTLDEINKRIEQQVRKYTGESTDAGGSGFGSAGGGGQGRGGGITRPPEFFRYQTLLERHIKTGWRWHDTSRPLTARVCFRMAPDGGMREIRVCQSSGDTLFDTSVLRAVEKANPAPPPPESVYNFFSEVRLTFTPQQSF